MEGQQSLTKDEIQMLRLNLEVARIGEVGTPQVQRILAEILHTA